MKLTNVCAAKYSPTEMKLELHCLFKVISEAISHLISEVAASLGRAL